MNRSYKIQILELFRELNPEIEGKEGKFKELLFIGEFCNRKIHPVYETDDGRIFVALRNGNQENLYFARTKKRQIFFSEFRLVEEKQVLEHLKSSENFLIGKI